MVTNCGHFSLPSSSVHHSGLKLAMVESYTMDISKHYKSGPTFSTPELVQFYQHVMARNPVCNWADKTIALSVVHSAEGPLERCWLHRSHSRPNLVPGGGQRRAVGCTEFTSVSWGPIGLIQNEPGLRPTWAGVLLAQCEERGGEWADF